MKREETPFLSTAMNFIDSEGMCNFIIYNTENQAICVNTFFLITFLIRNLTRSVDRTDECRLKWFEFCRALGNNENLHAIRKQAHSIHTM